MKKILTLMVMFLTISTIWVYAETNTDINFNIDGEVSKGKEVTININVDKADRLYGLSVDYTYNQEEIKVTSIQGAGLIKESKDNFFEAGGETAKDGNIANYQMTFTGEVDGISGSGTLVTIKAEVLKDTNLNLTEDNMKIKLIGINKDYKVSRMDFNLKELKEVKEDKKEETKEENTEDSSKPKEENKNDKVDKASDNELKEDKSTIFNKILKFFGVNNTNTQLQEEKNDNIKEENSKKDTSDESKKESKDNTEDKNVDTKKQDKDKENNKNTSSMLPVGVGGAVIVLVAAIVILKLKNKKGNKGEF